jgi:hypothetical protein
VIYRVDRSTGAFLGAVAPVEGVSLTTLMAQTENDGVPDYQMLSASQPVGFFDHMAQRFVLVWTSFAADASNSTQAPALWFAFTATADPTADWIVKAIDANPASGTGAACDPAATYLVRRRTPAGACGGQSRCALPPHYPFPFCWRPAPCRAHRASPALRGCPLRQVPDYPMTSYDANAVYVSVGVQCDSRYNDSVLWALPKGDYGSSREQQPPDAPRTPRQRPPTLAPASPVGPARRRPPRPLPVPQPSSTRRGLELCVRRSTPS